MSTWQKYLKDIYHNPANPASLSGPDKLFHFVQKDGKYNLSKYKLRKWLSSQDHTAYNVFIELVLWKLMATSFQNTLNGSFFIVVIIN
jgi:hypothetical protein